VRLIVAIAASAGAPHALVKTLDTFRHALLVTGQAAPGPGRVSLASSRSRLVGQLPLPVGELARFELEITHRTPLFIGLLLLHRPFELTEPFERSLTACLCLIGRLPPQLTDRSAHFLRRLAQLRAGAIP
jgi:hypothetical protein